MLRDERLRELLGELVGRLRILAGDELAVVLSVARERKEALVVAGASVFELSLEHQVRLAAVTEQGAATNFKGQVTVGNTRRTLDMIIEDTPGIGTLP